MKFPKSFRPEKDLDKKIEELINLDKNLDKSFERPNPGAVKRLLDSCEEYVEIINSKSDSRGVNREAYYLAKRMDYTLEDLKILAQCFRVRDDTYLDVGFYLSSMTNKVVPEWGSTTLVVNEALNGIGAFLKNISLTIEGNVYCFAGAHMLEGELIIKGNSGLFTGYGMSGGEIIVKGNCGINTGCLMKGGILRVEGNIERIFDNCQGTVYQKGEQVRPR
ncbi:MAG: hypothetical protein KKA79_08125 [Nanoarchaeota archaeon]|nr:hypothetical protein [Nanoarchaeota archaeon]MCG2717642.1 hypothetical protein [Nanoarchaeota archaeon]